MPVHLKYEIVVKWYMTKINDHSQYIIFRGYRKTFVQIQYNCLMEYCIHGHVIFPTPKYYQFIYRISYDDVLRSIQLLKIEKEMMNLKD